MSGQLRVRIVKRVAAGSLGVAEITLIDVPLDPEHWTKTDEAALERLERLAGLTDG